jgi:hypothetical protein
MSSTDPPPQPDAGPDAKSSSSGTGQPPRKAVPEVPAPTSEDHLPVLPRTSPASASRVVTLYSWTIASQPFHRSGRQGPVHAATVELAEQPGLMFMTRSSTFRKRFAAGMLEVTFKSCRRS